MFIFPGQKKICSEPQAASLPLSDHKPSLIFIEAAELVIRDDH